MHILVTAGPTREYLDPVRFLSNGSTGKMGYACAEAAKRRGHRVTLVSGSVAGERPKGVRVIDVVSATEMNAAVREVFDDCDCVIMTAAVCDYRPARRQKYKISKSDDNMQLELERTCDILAGLAEAKTDQVLIGFAVQDRSARPNARRKLVEKKLDAIILNGPAAFGADKVEAAMLTRGGRWKEVGTVRKAVLATRIVRLAERLRRGH